MLWIAGHAGPETAEDSRTHFGIFETAVTQLFPEGHVIDLHPWEYNEVPVVLGAALATNVPLVALHLTRPSIELPDREALGMPSHFEAARGAYVMRDFKPGPRGGTVFVQGTTTTANVVKVLPQLDERGLNVKIVACISPQLFAMQDEAYRESVASLGDRWDGMAVTNRAWQTMRHWIGGPIARDYSLSSDWDDRWRTGGTVDEVIDEAHLGRPTSSTRSSASSPSVTAVSPACARSPRPPPATSRPMSRTAYGLTAVTASLLAIVGFAWLDSTVLKEAQQQASAEFDASRYTVLWSLCAVLLAAVILGLAAIAWRSESSLVGLFYLLLGGFIAFLAAIVTTLAANSGGGSLGRIISPLLLATSGPMNAVGMVGASMLVIGLVLLVRWARSVSPRART